MKQLTRIVIQSKDRIRGSLADFYVKIPFSNIDFGKQFKVHVDNVIIRLNVTTEPYLLLCSDTLMADTTQYDTSTINDILVPIRGDSGSTYQVAEYKKTSDLYNFKANNIQPIQHFYFRKYDGTILINQDTEVQECLIFITIEEC